MHSCLYMYFCFVRDSVLPLRDSRSHQQTYRSAPFHQRQIPKEIHTFQTAIRKYTRQYRFRTEFKINAILLKSHQSVLEENRSLYHECVPVLKSESILIFLTVKYRFLQLPDPVPPAIHDRTDLSVLNQLEIQFKFPAPMSVPPS